ncbi:MAG: CBS domain-containing protein [Candidatus Lokiarchaeota archaeon]|nr:CBS domain-containing protein [Candidatus Lokiarchaeota archaeon]
MKEEKPKIKDKSHRYFRDKIGNEYGWALTFDDVICEPGYTDFNPDDVNLETKLGPYNLKLPIISASMDTVTEDEMAIELALLGGLGVLHRNCTYEKQLQMVEKVKRARSFIVENVATVHPDDQISVVRHKMEDLNISGFVVVDENNKVVGICTARDLPFDERENPKVKEVMTKNPIYGEIGISQDEALNKLYDIRKEKLPLVDSEGKLVGLITIKDLKPEFPNASKDEKGRLLVGLGISPSFPSRLQDAEIFEKIDGLCDIFMTDVADVFKKNDLLNIKNLIEHTTTPIIIGNIGGYDAAEYILTKLDFPDDRVVGLKVGMGSGSICTTTLQTGVGAPTLFACAEVADALATYGTEKTIIADGGFKNPGDLTKAFAVGADAIMSGHLFAGCTESPGYVDTIGGRKVKVYRGMGSKEARALGTYVDDRYIASQKRLSEGVSDYVPFVGPVKGVIDQLYEGLKNGFIYSGARDIGAAKHIKLRKVTYSGKIESSAHDLLGRK